MRLAFLPVLLLFILLSSCAETKTKKSLKIRHQKDTIGFAQYNWQLDSLIARMDPKDQEPEDAVYKAAICPHDDYAYAGGLIYKTLQGIKAKTVILVGVAHRAGNFRLKDRVIFGSYNKWQSANGTIQVSPMRDQILQKLKKETFTVHDSMMQLEHSLEAITPFLQKLNPEVEIIPLLVPYMKFEDMETFSQDVSMALWDIMKAQKLAFGEDVAIVISNDAIHYGNTDWGGSNLALFGVDSIGNEKARQKDLELINSSLLGKITNKKVEDFTKTTVMEHDYKEYKWTWCGRYSTPFGLLLARDLNFMAEEELSTSLTGTLIDYRSSLHNPHIEVTDLGMGHTAPASNSHWVAFVGIGYY